MDRCIITGQKHSKGKQHSSMRTFVKPWPKLGLRGGGALENIFLKNCWSWNLKEECRIRWEDRSPSKEGNTCCSRPCGGKDHSKGEAVDKFMSLGTEHREKSGTKWPGEGGTGQSPWILMAGSRVWVYRLSAVESQIWVVQTTLAVVRRTDWNNGFS